MNIDEMIELLQAYKDGKKIEMFDPTQGIWIDVKKPLWNFANCNYRIKKKPTNLEIANNLWEKTFGIANRFNDNQCPSLACCDCPRNALPECNVKSWWHKEYEGEIK